jgi:hypothetical protein
MGCLSILLIGSTCCQESTTLPETELSLEKIGQIKSRSTHEIDTAVWSVGGETMDRDYTIYKNWSPYLEAMGIKNVRLQAGWAKTEKAKGQYDWAWLDEPVYDLPKKGINPWLSLSYGNPLYGKGETKLGSKIDTDPDTRAAWLRWVRTAVSRYKNKVHAWEIWNEPNGHNPPEVYAELLIQTAEVVKDVQPDAIVLGFALAGIDITFAEEVLKILEERGKTELVDYLAYHPYNFNPDESYEKVEELRRVMHQYAPGMKLYQGENGAPSEYRKTKALREYDWTELTQAKWALRRMLGDLGRDIPSSIFSIVDLKYPDEMNRKGLLYANEDKTVAHRKQAYFAVQHLAAIFDNSLSRIENFEYTAKTDEAHSAFAYAKKNSGDKLVTIWLHSARPSDENVTKAVEVHFDDIQFEAPVWVDLRTGAVYDIPASAYKAQGKGTTFSQLPLYDSPVVIAEKRIINLQ